ncbi:MAG TPA: hypothetical protein VLX61_10260 [Anaerolineales bacterium]|nr:hypothetical protein [Anaerolineales bacterium]
MSSLLELIFKKPLVVGAVALIVGIVLGIFIGWNTVTVVNTTPAVMRFDLQEDYLRMAIDSFRVNQDPNLAVQRWKNLGPAAAPAFSDIQKNPRGLDPAVILAYGKVIQSVLGASSANPPASSGGLSFGMEVLFGAIAVILLVAVVVAVVFLRRLLGKRSSGEVTPTMQMTEANREAESKKTDFQSLGVAPPITQNMTTYVLGDDLYDESFSIDTQSGDFLGEYGVGVSEIIGVGDPKKVTALEIWLFDKNDIKTATKVLMSAHAFSDATTRSRLEPKGELVLVDPQKQVMLETATLQLLAKVIDLQYGNGALPTNSFFERLTLELAIWQKSNKSA